MLASVQRFASRFLPAGHYATAAPEATPAPAGARPSWARGPNDRRPLSRAEQKAKAAAEADLDEKARFTLTPEQLGILDAINDGSNVFFSGPGGSGKTHLLRFLKKKYEYNQDVYFTAATGMAASLFSGTTVHSWACVKIADQAPDVYIEYIKSRSFLLDKLQRATKVFLDEISMISGEALEVIDETLRGVRNCEAPFGGIQLIVSGDFAQLPPVSRRHEKKKRYAFNSTTWRAARFKPFLLKTMHRQQNLIFADGLNKLRWGILTPEMEEILEDSVRRAALPWPVGLTDIRPTRLYSHVADVEKENDEEQMKLAGREYVFESLDNGPEALIKQLGDKTPRTLVFKVGAQVMLTRNMGRDLVNGSRGVILSFDNREGKTSDGKYRDESSDSKEHPYYPMVKFKSGVIKLMKPEVFDITQAGKCLASREQVPLRLAYAMTIHKAQGVTLDSAYMDLSKCFEDGMFYTSVSRVKEIAGLFISAYNKRAIKCSPEVVAFYKSIEEALEKGPVSSSTELAVAKLTEDETLDEKTRKNLISWEYKKQQAAMEKEMGVKRPQNKLPVATYSPAGGALLEDDAEEVKMGGGGWMGGPARVKKEVPKNPAVTTENVVAWREAIERGDNDGQLARNFPVLTARNTAAIPVLRRNAQTKKQKLATVPENVKEEALPTKRVKRDPVDVFRHV